MFHMVCVNRSAGPFIDYSEACKIICDILGIIQRGLMAIDRRERYFGNAGQSAIIAAVKIEQLYKDSFPIIQANLDAREAIIAESSTLVGMSSNVTVETKVRGGQIKSFLRGQAGTTAYYLNTYRALSSNAEVLLAPRRLGDVRTYPLGKRDSNLLITVDAFLAAQEAVNLETAWRGASTFQMTSGLQMLRCSGDGNLIISSFGAIHTVELKEGKTFLVDRGHLVGFTDKVQMRVRQLGGVRSTLVRGQEIVFELEGPGNVYLQTRNQEMFVNWLRGQTRP